MVSLLISITDCPLLSALIYGWAQSTVRRHDITLMSCDTSTAAETMPGAGNAVNTTVILTGTATIAKHSDQHSGIQWESHLVS
jgi:hypothetical protein